MKKICISAELIEIDAYEVVQVLATRESEHDDVFEIDEEEVRRYAEAFHAFKRANREFEESLKHAQRTRNAGDIVWTT